MTAKTNSNAEQTKPDSPAAQDQYQKGLDLAEAGKHTQALECIQRYISSYPDDAEALNDTGAILHCMGRSDEAIEHLTKAKKIQTDSAEITWNLAETCLAAGKTDLAIELFDDMEQMNLLNPELLNRTANILLDQDKPAQALKMLEWSKKLLPDQDILGPMIEVVRSKLPENETADANEIAVNIDN
ncbi:tetratricopeptide repeat protein [Planctomycetota bacterium]